MRKASLLFLLMFFTAPAFAEKPGDAIKDALDPQSELVIKSITERYEKLRTWKASFQHTNTSAALGTSRLSQGEFVFSYPARFRFSLNGPSEVSDFISNGKEAWYVRYPQGRDKAALVQHFKDVTSLELDKYLLLLRGLSSEQSKDKSLTQDFKVSSEVDETRIVLILEPKRSSDLEKVHLSFLQNEEHPELAHLTDSLGGESLIKINKVTKLERVHAQEFAPKYSKDSRVEVVSP